MRIDDETYNNIKLAAQGQKKHLKLYWVCRSAVQYLHSSSFVDDIEMKSIVNDKQLLSELEEGLTDFKDGRWKKV